MPAPGHAIAFSNGVQRGDRGSSRLGLRLTAVATGYPNDMNATNQEPDNPGTGPSNRDTPDSMSQADRANGEGNEPDQVAADDNDDSADTDDSPDTKSSRR